MTPDHRETIEQTLQLTYARANELNNMLCVPFGKNPPRYTRERMWNSTLGRDLQAVANYGEGYSAAEDIIIVLSRIARTLFGHTLNQQGFRLPQIFHMTKLGEMIFDAFARYYPAQAWMRTSEVQRLFGVQRQTIYDWAEEGKLFPYFIKGTQMFLRDEVERFHSAWKYRKQQK